MKTLKTLILDPEIWESLNQMSRVMIIGALLGLPIGFMIFTFVLGFEWSEFKMNEAFISFLLGGLCGLVMNGLYLLAIQTVTRANAAQLKKNAQHAKKMGAKLKALAREKAKSKIFREAQDLLQQLNGPDVQKTLDVFFDKKFEAMAYHTYKKIERHFNYLIDRAVCGDFKALQKLNQLTAKSKSHTSPLDKMIERIFNARTLFQLKDDIDNAYDEWRYGLSGSSMT